VLDPVSWRQLGRVTRPTLLSNMPQIDQPRPPAMQNNNTSEWAILKMFLIFLHVVNKHKSY